MQRPSSVILSVMPCSSKVVNGKTVVSIKGLIVAAILIYHGLVGVLLELHKTHACHMLQLAALNIVQLVAIEKGHHGRRGDAQRLLAINIPGDNIVCMQQRLSNEQQGRTKMSLFLGIFCLWPNEGDSQNYGRQLSCQLLCG